MRRSVIRGGFASLALLASLLPDVAAAQISAGPPNRLVDLVEVTEHDQQVDLAVQFNCSMRYVTHLPASEGSELHVQLLPLGDCGINALGQIVPEVPPVSDDSGVLLSARLESDAPGQVTLLLRWRKPEQFVI